MAQVFATSQRRMRLAIWLAVASGTLVESLPARPTQCRRPTPARQGSCPEARSPADSRVRFSVDCHEACLLIRVVDEGEVDWSAVGTRVFDPLYTTKPQAFGLGLPLAQAIALRHDGHITIGPAPHGGTMALMTIARSRK